MKHSYPSFEVANMDEDDVTQERNVKLLLEESGKVKSKNVMISLLEPLKREGNGF